MALKHFFLLLPLFLLSCTKESTRTALKFEINQCCNFYSGTDCENDVLAETIDCFFEEENIETFELFIAEVGIPSICINCCFCPEGKILFLEVEEEDVEKLLELDFVKV